MGGVKHDGFCPECFIYQEGGDGGTISWCATYAQRDLSDDEISSIKATLATVNLQKRFWEAAERGGLTAARGLRRG